MFNRKKFNPVLPWSLKGNLLVNTLRGLFTLRNRLGGQDWDSVWPEHHEDPFFMRFPEQLYFGHKYYYRAITKPDEGSNLEAHFRSNAGQIETPSDFKPDTEITLTAGGDLMPYASINREICKDLWNEVGDFFFDADLVTANLETPMDLTRPHALVPEVMLNHMYFNASEEMFDVYSGLGKYKPYDVLSVANNHSLDMGVDGLKRTLDFLEDRNIRYCGAARSAEQRDAFPIIDVKGIRVAFLAATFSLNTESRPEDMPWLVNHLQLNQESPDISLLVEQARIAREKGADLIVAHLHTGCAYQPYPSLRIVQNIREICRQTGIDIVLGGHPHNPQPLEFLNIRDPFSDREKQSFIVYSLGDFVAYDIFKWCHVPLVLKFRIGKNASGTFITGLEAKVLYTQSIVKNGKIQALRFKDAGKLLQGIGLEDLDARSKKEFGELRYFLEQLLLPGNIERFMNG
ncbi:MAG: CapA family protein [Bacteroidota bacterium]